MDYMTTYTGENFSPIKPEVDKINIKDIAHALSMLCRGNGHLKHFYSVAQHSVNCCLEAKARGHSKKVQLMCLIHDASEGYIADITRPVKAHLSDYLVYEEILQNVIYKKYILDNITENDLFEMKEIDDAVLYYELNRLMSIGGHEEPKLLSEINIEFTPFEIIENKFLELFEELTK